METNTENFGVRRVNLRQLDPDINNALIVAIIIAKQRPRKYNNPRSNDNRSVWNFTVRDSPQDYINVTFWGQGDEILKLNDSFQIGDIINITNPKIVVRDMDAYGEQFRPMVTSPYHLYLYDNRSNVVMHDYNAHTTYKRLLSLPTKPLAGFVTLSDIQNSGSGRVGYFVDILVAVKSIGNIRSVKTKEGIEQQVRDFIVLDHSCSSGVRISLWDPDLIIRAGFWTPRSTVLFMTDMKIEYNNFHKCFLPNITSRTIITENPCGPEAESIKKYALTAPLQPTEILERLSCNIGDINSIQNVMSIRQVLDRMESAYNPVGDVNRTDDNFTALLYVFVTNLDLDGLSRTVSYRCSRCKSWLESNDKQCENLECNLGSDSIETESKFDLRVSLSDHTGSLANCRLTGEIAVNVLDCDVKKFCQMTDTEKCLLKWKYLMERCAVRIMVLCLNGASPLCSILSCTLAAPNEVANKLPHY